MYHVCIHYIQLASIKSICQQRVRTSHKIDVYTYFNRCGYRCMTYFSHLKSISQNTIFQSCILWLKFYCITCFHRYVTGRKTATVKVDLTTKLNDYKWRVQFQRFYFLSFDLCMYYINENNICSNLITTYTLAQLYELYTHYIDRERFSLFVFSFKFVMLSLPGPNTLSDQMLLYHTSSCYRPMALLSNFLRLRPSPSTTTNDQQNKRGLEGRIDFLFFFGK